jgi:hypothetical protein
MTIYETFVNPPRSCTSVPFWFLNDELDESELVGRIDDLERHRVSGQDHYVGAYLAWGVNNTGWWGEGEIKSYLDGDEEWPTIGGTGTEDCFFGSYNFDRD